MAATSITGVGGGSGARRPELPVRKFEPPRSNFGLIVFSSLIIMSIAGFLMTLLILDLKVQVSNLEHQLSNTRTWAAEIEKESGDERREVQAQILQLQNIVTAKENK